MTGQAQPRYATEEYVQQAIFSMRNDFITKEKQIDLDRAKKAEEQKEKSEILTAISDMRKDMHTSIQALSDRTEVNRQKDKSELVAAISDLRKDMQASELKLEKSIIDSSYTNLKWVISLFGANTALIIGTLLLKLLGI